MIQTPRRVRVGCRVFDVVPLSNREADVMSSLGFFDSEAGQIKLKHHDDELAGAETFWHELFHAIHYSAGLYDMPDEEEITEREASVFLAMIVDNPELLTHLAEFVGKFKHRLNG